MNTKLTASSICALAALIALAAPEGVEAGEFKGPYAGAEAGLGIVKTDGTTILGPVNNSESSGLFSGVLGYRSPVGESERIVLGIEGIFGFYTQGTNKHYGVYGIGGYRVGENGLLYLRAGYGGVDGVLTPVGTGVDGPAFGGGYEVHLSNSTALRLDYRYLSYGDVNTVDSTFDFSGHEITTAFLFTF